MSRLLYAACVLNVWWMYNRCVMGVLWMCYGCFMVCNGCVIDVLWMVMDGEGCERCITNVLWMCEGCVMDALRMCYIKDVLRMPDVYVMDEWWMLYIYIV